jgi:ATP-dependent DNA helicase Rep
LRYLLVDEYQDTNGAQYELLKLLAGVAGRFTAVGDDDQAIYAWRGADIENLRRLGDDYPDLKIIPLTQNYRSSQRILRAANSVIKNNPRLHEKNLWSEHGMGDQIELLQCRDDRHEAETIALRISAHKFECRTRFADYAILYRGNHQARLFEEALREAKISYQISGGQSFFDKSEIKDLTAYLRLIANPDDDPAFIRAVTTPRRGIGAGTLEKLGDHAGQRHISLFAAAFETAFQAGLQERQLEPLTTFCDFINRIADRAEKEAAGSLLDELLAAIQYEEWLYETEDDRSAKAKWLNVRDFVEWLRKKGAEDGKTLIELTQTVALMNLLEGREGEEVDAVRLSTLHAAKGLEFPHVYLVGVEEEILPHRECLEGARLEEERRLMYVGITRAQRSLVISYCARRKRGGEITACDPSRFLEEIDPNEVKRSGAGAVADTAEVKEDGRRRLSALKAMLSK